MEKKVESMTEEEFAEASRAAGWDEEWIKEVIEEARQWADDDWARKHHIIALPVDMQLAMMFEHAQYGPPIVESDPLPPVEELPA